MPWCPKCKMEYREGITVCSDCKIELVEELEQEVEMVTILQAVEKNVLEKIVSYFDYSGLQASVQYNEENEVYEVFVPAKQQKQAKKLYQAFLLVESERLVKEDHNSMNNTSNHKHETDEEQTVLTEEDGLVEDTSDIKNTDNDNGIMDDTTDDAMEEDLEEEDTEVDSAVEQGVYVMKADKYKDLRDTVLVFLLFGIAGIIVVILNIVGILTFLNGVIPNLVLGAVFLFFIYVGLSTHKKAKVVQSEIETEKKLTNDINQWLEFNITESFLASINDDTISEEINYIKKTEAIKNLLIKEFGEQNASYLDRLIEEFYSSKFEGNE